MLVWDCSCMAKLPEFKEILPTMDPPDTCPPSDATPPSRQCVVRFVLADPPTIDDFRSHNLLGQPRNPQVDACRWASCSVFSSLPALNKLPRIRERFKYFVTFEIDENSGVVKTGRGGHLDLWMFASFDPLGNLICCAPL